MPGARLSRPKFEAGFCPADDSASAGVLRYHVRPAADDEGRWRLRLGLRRQFVAHKIGALPDAGIAGWRQIHSRDFDPRVGRDDGATPSALATTDIGDALPAMAVASVALALAEPPPVTITWFAACDGALEATFTVTVMAG